MCESTCPWTAAAPSTNRPLGEVAWKTRQLSLYSLFASSLPNLIQGFWCLQQLQICWIPMSQYSHTQKSQWPPTSTSPSSARKHTNLLSSLQSQLFLVAKTSFSLHNLLSYTSINQQLTQHSPPYSIQQTLHSILSVQQRFGNTILCSKPKTGTNLEQTEIQRARWKFTWPWRIW